MPITFDLTILYSQIAVFEPDLQNPFNDWKQQHVEQGFAWRPGSVSFGTLGEGDTAKVEVVVAPGFELSSEAVRAIAVPFQVTGPRGVVVASIAGEHGADVPPGTYALIYETKALSEYDLWIRFTFVEQAAPEAKILLADAALSPREPLLMEAEAAV